MYRLFVVEPKEGGFKYDLGLLNGWMVFAYSVRSNPEPELHTFWPHEEENFWMPLYSGVHTQFHLKAKSTSQTNERATEHTLLPQGTKKL